MTNSTVLIDFATLQVCVLILFLQTILQTFFVTKNSNEYSTSTLWCFVLRTHFANFVKTPFANSTNSANSVVIIRSD